MFLLTIAAAALSGSKVPEFNCLIMVEEEVQFFNKYNLCQ